MAYLFLQGIQPNSEEAKDVLKCLSAPSKNVEFPKGLLESVDWDAVIVAVPTLPNGVAEGAADVHQYYQQAPVPEDAPQVEPNSLSTSGLRASAPEFVPGKSWSFSASTDIPMNGVNPSSGLVNGVAPPPGIATPVGLPLAPGIPPPPGISPSPGVPPSGVEQPSQVSAFVDGSTSSSSAPLQFNNFDHSAPSDVYPGPGSFDTHKEQKVITPQIRQRSATTEKPTVSPFLQFGEVNLETIIKDKAPVVEAEVTKEESVKESPATAQIPASPPSPASQHPADSTPASTGLPPSEPLANSANTKPSLESAVSSPKSPPAVEAAPGLSNVNNSARPNETAAEMSASSLPAEAGTVTSAETKTAAPKAASSWASLFNKGPSPNPRPSPLPEQTPIEVALNTLCEKPANEIGALLAEMKLSQGVVAIQPRRLINRANYCYVNATLQALLACPPFYHMLKSLPSFPALTAQKSVTPVLDALIQFINEFSAPDRSNQGERRRGKHDIRWDTPLEPTGIYDVLPKLKSAASENLFLRGRQEDAEEFLTCVLNTLDEEITEAVKQNKQAKDDMRNGHDHSSSSDGEAVEEDEEENDSGGDWKQVGPRNKAVVTHSSHIDNRSMTLISKIFGGCLRSSLSTSSSESATLEPFFTVPLNVQTAKSIEEALQMFVCKEYIDGYTDPTTKLQLDAHRKFTFDQLPAILLLHLKCFVYDQRGGSLKVNHTMEFKENLLFEKELLSPLAQKNLNKTERSYKLFAVVYHYGEKTTGGHYHTDVFHTGQRCWVRFDDDSVKTITLSQVFEKKQSCVPYLLYYKRLDTMQSPSNSASQGNK